jgi:hypothetical protein
MEALLTSTVLFQRIECVGERDDCKLCKVGPGISNSMLRKWLLRNPDENQKRWAYPQNVVMIGSTVVGTVMNMCHGAGTLCADLSYAPTWVLAASGVRTKTMADIVYGIEYMDCDGNLIPVAEDDTNPHTIQTLAGSFGVIGIVVSVTLKLAPMLYGDLHVEKTSMFSAIPPRYMSDIPESMRNQIAIDMNAAALEAASLSVPADEFS